MAEDRKSQSYYDRNGNAAPLMYGESNQKLEVSSTSILSSVLNEGAVLTIYSDEDAYVAIGDDTVVATDADRFIPGNNIPTEICLGANTYIAMIQRDSSGTAHVHEYK